MLSAGSTIGLCIGPAEVTGKPSLRVAMGGKKHSVGRRAVSESYTARNAVEAGERLGFLPGEVIYKTR